MPNGLLPVKTYAINLAHRADRKQHIHNQFYSREEFNLQIVTAHTHPTGAVGLWNTIKHILENLVSTDDAYIIICEDDHQFTEQYSRDLLVSCIHEAISRNAAILSGGVSSFTNAIKISENLFWVEKFSGLQFTVLFNHFFNTILTADFKENDESDYKLCSLTQDKFFIHPFISVQKEFGYSDITQQNSRIGYVKELFTKSSASAEILKEVYAYYSRNTTKNEKKAAIEDIDGITMPVYIISMLQNEERKHIEDEFTGKNEFEARYIVPSLEKGKYGIWLCIRSVIEAAIAEDEDVIIICDDNHRFTSHYSKQYLLGNIFEAHKQGAGLLSGGVGDFTYAVPVTQNLYWLNPVGSSSFMIIYKQIFSKILRQPFDRNIDPEKLFSELISNKLVICPFISIQKEAASFYQNAEERLLKTGETYQLYNNL